MGPFCYADRVSEPEIKPVYVLYGSDAFLLRKQMRQTVAAIIGDGDPQIAVSNFDSDTDLAVVLDELRTAPLLSARRAVVMTSADAFVSAYRQQIEKYLTAPSMNSSLVLAVVSWQKNTRLYKLVQQIGKNIDCSPPRARDIASWIVNAAKKRRKTINQQAAEELSLLLGQDLATIDSEIEKLSLYVGERSEITPHDVAAVVTATAGSGAFAVTNNVTAGNVSGALKALADSLTQSGEQFRLLGQLAWHLRRALRAQQAIQTGASPAGACKKVGVSFGQRQFIQMLNRRPLDALQKDFRKLLAADLAMKTGSEPEATLSELVVALCT